MQDTRSLVESSLLVALSVVLFLASHFLPLVGIVISFFCPVPLVILGLKVPAEKALLGAFVAAVLITMFMGLLGGVFFLFGFAIMGVALGMFGRRIQKASDIVFYGFLVSLSCKLVLMALVKLLTGINPFAIDPDLITKSLDNALAVFSNGYGEAFLESMKAQAETMSRLMVHILPAILIAASFFDCAVSFVISEKVARRFKVLSLPPIPSFGTWRFPRSVLLAFFASFILSFFAGKGNNIDMLAVLSLNLKVLSMMIFLIQGLATLWYILANFLNINARKWLGVMILAFSLLVPILSTIVIMLGFFDMLIDLRVKIRR